MDCGAVITVLEDCIREEMIAGWWGTRVPCIGVNLICNIPPK